MTAQRLSALDTAFLELEQADPSAHMHLGGVMVFDPLPGGGIPDVGMLRRLVGSRLDAFPRHRRRLSHPHTGALRFLEWVPDEDFDIRRHVRRAALPAPGRERELLAWAGTYFSQRLGRRRPLWEAVLLEGLAGGRWAIATKTHHCMVDGLSAVDAAALFLDLPAALAPPAGDQSHGGPLGAVGAVARAARHPDRLFGQARALTGLLADELLPAPGSSLNEPIGVHRRLVLTRARLSDLKAIRRALGGTVNDVLLTCVAGGLRELLLAPRRGAPACRAARDGAGRPARPGTGTDLGNRVSSLFIALPVAEPDAVERLAHIRAETDRAKRTGQAAGPAALLALADLAPPALHLVVGRPALGTRLFNVTVTNVPGPQQRLSALGARLREMIPIVPLAAEHAVGVAILSYAGRVVVCANCDRDAVPDAQRLARGSARTLRELRAAADNYPGDPAVSPDGGAAART